MSDEEKIQDVVWTTDGENYYTLEDLRTVVEAVDISDTPDIQAECVWQGECAGSVTYKIKKRHQSRKWKKKRGLLKRQHKLAFKRFKKVIVKLVNSAKKAAISVNHLREVTTMFTDDMEVYE